MKKRVDFLIFFICCIVLVIILISKSRTTFVRENTLEIMRRTCKDTNSFINVFIDAGPDELSSQKAMECACRALDMADCPEKVHVFVIIPTQYFARKSSWDNHLESICSSQSRYSTFFESNMHLFKIGTLRYASGGLKTVAKILVDLETIESHEIVVWMPILSKVEKCWDTHIRKDWNSVNTVSHNDRKSTILSYPMLTVPSLEQDIEGYLFQREITSTPSYYFINSSLNLECRPFASNLKSVVETLYISSNYPMVMSKTCFTSIENCIHGEDLQFSFALQSQSQSQLFIGMHSIGFTYRRNTSAVPLGLGIAIQHLPGFKDWVESIGIKVTDGFLEVMIQGKLGVGKRVSLDEKILKWGTEIKYESFKEAYLSEREEDKN